MDIAFVHPTHPLAGGDGATFTATKLVEELLSRGHELTVFCLDDSAEPAEIDADVRVLDTDGRLPFNVEINRALRRNRHEFDGFDVVHSYKTRSIPGMIDVASETDAATLVSLTAYGAICPKNDLFYKNSTVCSKNGYARCAGCAATTGSPHSSSAVSDPVDTIKWTVGRLLNHRQNTVALDRLDRIDGFHTYTDHMKTTYTEFGFPSEDIHVVDNILDSRFRGSPKRAVEDPVRLLYVGRLTPAKGVDKLVPIYDRVAEQVDRRVTLTVLGEGELSEEIRARADSSPFTDGIDIRGYVSYDELPSLYRAHDLLVTPQEWNEPFGRVYMEALAAGTPVVSSDSGAAAEIVRDGGVVTGHSVDALADAVVDIVRRGRIGVLSARAVENVGRYEEGVVLPQFEQLYREAITGGQAKSSTH